MGEVPITSAPSSTTSTTTTTTSTPTTIATAPLLITTTNTPNKQIDIQSTSDDDENSDEIGKGDRNRLALADATQTANSNSKHTNDNVFEAVISSPRPFVAQNHARPSATEQTFIDATASQPKVSSASTIPPNAESTATAVHIAIDRNRSSHQQNTNGIRIDNQINGQQVSGIGNNTITDNLSAIRQTIVAHVNISAHRDINDLESLQGIGLLHDSNINEGGSDLTLSEHSILPLLVANQRHWYTTPTSTPTSSSSNPLSTPTTTKASSDESVSSTANIRLRQRRPTRRPTTAVPANTVDDDIQSAPDATAIQRPQSRRRYRPRPEDIESESNNSSRNELNRSYRPTGESELSSLTSFDFAAAQGQRVGTSRRIWPTRRAHNETSDLKETIASVDGNAISDEQSTQRPLRTRPTRPTRPSTTAAAEKESTERVVRTRPTRGRTSTITTNSSESDVADADVTPSDVSSQRRGASRYSASRRRPLATSASSTAAPETGNAENTSSETEEGSVVQSRLNANYYGNVQQRRRRPQTLNQSTETVGNITFIRIVDDNNGNGEYAITSQHKPRNRFNARRSQAIENGQTVVTADVKNNSPITYIAQESTSATSETVTSESTESTTVFTATEETAVTTESETLANDEQQASDESTTAKESIVIGVKEEKIAEAPVKEQYATERKPFSGRRVVLRQRKLNINSDGTSNPETETNSISTNNQTRTVIRRRRPITRDPAAVENTAEQQLQSDNESNTHSRNVVRRRRPISRTTASSDAAADNTNEIAEKQPQVLREAIVLNQRRRPVTRTTVTTTSAPDDDIQSTFDDSQSSTESVQSTTQRRRYRYRTDSTSPEPSLDTTIDDNNVDSPSANFQANSIVSNEEEAPVTRKNILRVRKPVYRKRTSTTTSTTATTPTTATSNKTNRDEQESSSKTTISGTVNRATYRLASERRFGNRFKSTKAPENEETVSEEQVSVNAEENNIREDTVAVTHRRKVYNRRPFNVNLLQKESTVASAPEDETSNSDSAAISDSQLDINRKNILRRPSFANRQRVKEEDAEQARPSSTERTVEEKQERRRKLFSRTRVTTTARTTEAPTSASTEPTLTEDENGLDSIITTESSTDDVTRVYATESLISLFSGIDIDGLTESLNTEAMDEATEGVTVTTDAPNRLTQLPTYKPKKVSGTATGVSIIEETISSESSSSNVDQASDNLRHAKTIGANYRRGYLAGRIGQRNNHIDVAEESIAAEADATSPAYADVSEDDTTDENEHLINPSLSPSTRSRLLHGHGIYKPTKPYRPIPKESSPDNDDQSIATSHRPYVRKYVSKFTLPRRPNEEEPINSGSDQDDPNLIKNLKPIVRESTVSPLAPIKQHRFKLRHRLKLSQYDNENELSDSAVADHHHDDDVDDDHDDKDDEDNQHSGPHFVPLKPDAAIASKSSVGKVKIANSPVNIPTKAHNNRLHLTTIHPASLRQYESKLAHTTEPTLFNRNKYLSNTSQKQSEQHTHSSASNDDDDDNEDGWSITTVSSTEIGDVTSPAVDYTDTYDEHTVIPLPEQPDTSNNDLNSINLVDHLQANTLRKKPKASATTTTQKPTTFHHIFAIDYDEHASAKDGVKSITDADRVAEVISKRVEKLAEVNRIVEVYSQHQKQKIKTNSNNSNNNYGGEKSKMSNLVIERLPTVNKIGEISRITLIKLIDRHNASAAGSPNFLDILTTAAVTQKPIEAPIKHTVDVKKARNLVMPETIFSVETSTIPLEGLFQMDRNGKNVNIVYATSPEQAAGSHTFKDHSTEGRPSPVYIPTSTTTTAQPPVLLASATDNVINQLPYSDDASKAPLVITLANVDNVLISKVTSKSDNTLVSSVKVSASLDESIENQTPSNVDTVDSTTTEPPSVAVTTTDYPSTDKHDSDDDNDDVEFTTNVDVQSNYVHTTETAVSVTTTVPEAEIDSPYTTVTNLNELNVAATTDSESPYTTSLP